MKAVQTWVGLVVLILVIFVVTLLSQSLSTQQSTDKQTNGIDEPAPPKLNFPVTVVDDNTISEIRPVKGTRDFWFENPNPEPLEVALEQISCKCSEVQILTFKKEEEPVYDQWRKQRELLVLTASRGLLPTLVGVVATDGLVRDSVGAPARWTSLMFQGKVPLYVPVPPQTQGLVRLTWEGKEPRPQRLKTILQMRQPDQPKTNSFVSLEMPVKFVDVLSVERPAVDVDELPPGARKVALFACSSPTRAAFRLEAREKTGDPCVHCEVHPMTEQQREYLQHSRAPEAALPVLGGYVVAVTVSERAGDKQLDLGPFQREIVLTSDDTSETHTLSVKGVVVGEVRILGEQAKHRVDLGQFDALGGKSVDLILESDRPSIKLEADSHYPSFLQVELKEAGVAPAGGRQWNLHVAVPPDKAFGKLPPESVVVLKTQDAPPRRLRIPVSGQGTTR